MITEKHMYGITYSESYVMLNILILFIEINKRVRIIEFDIPQHEDYVCLESFQKREDKKVRFLHIIKFTKKKK